MARLDQHKAGHDEKTDSIRYMATPTIAKHRLFVWIEGGVCPDHQLIVIARDDDTAFGILHSRFHEAWSLRLGTSLEDRPRYTPTTTFETFPFPEGLTPNIPAGDYAAGPRARRIATAAKKLDDLRRTWLNPPDLVEIVPEVTPTAAPGEAPRRYPDRILPKNAEAAVKLKERTLTNLYNQRPRWLADTHNALDRAVAAAYGWPEDISTEDALARLLGLNLERARVEVNIQPSRSPNPQFFPCLIQVSGEIGYFVCLIPVAANKSWRIRDFSVYFP
jgi:type II restriction/modification system DNA methylase subunit YeeA